MAPRRPLDPTTPVASTAHRTARAIEVGTEIETEIEIGMPVGTDLRVGFLRMGLRRAVSLHMNLPLDPASAVESEAATVSVTGIETGGLTGTETETETETGIGVV